MWTDGRTTREQQKRKQRQRGAGGVRTSSRGEQAMDPRCVGCLCCCRRQACVLVCVCVCVASVARAPKRDSRRQTHARRAAPGGRSGSTYAPTIPRGTKFLFPDGRTHRRRTDQEREKHARSKARLSYTHPPPAIKPAYREIPSTTFTLLPSRGAHTNVIHHLCRSWHLGEAEVAGAEGEADAEEVPPSPPCQWARSPLPRSTTSAARPRTCTQ